VGRLRGHPPKQEGGGGPSLLTLALVSSLSASERSVVSSCSARVAHPLRVCVTPQQPAIWALASGLPTVRAPRGQQLVGTPGHPAACGATREDGTATLLQCGEALLSQPRCSTSPLPEQSDLALIASTAPLPLGLTSAGAAQAPRVPSPWSEGHGKGKGWSAGGSRAVPVGMGVGTLAPVQVGRRIWGSAAETQAVGPGAGGCRAAGGAVRGGEPSLCCPLWGSDTVVQAAAGTGRQALVPVLWPVLSPGELCRADRFHWGGPVARLWPCPLPRGQTEARGCPLRVPSSCVPGLCRRSVCAAVLHVRTGGKGTRVGEPVLRLGLPVTADSGTAAHCQKKMKKGCTAL